MTSKIAYTAFTKRQRNLIRRLIEIQMESLQDLLKGESEQDIDLFCAQNNFSVTSLKTALIEEGKAYARIHTNPDLLFTLDEFRLSVFRHLLYNNLKKKSLREIKHQIWVKIQYFDTFSENFNLN